METAPTKETWFETIGMRWMNHRYMFWAIGLAVATSMPWIMASQTIVETREPVSAIAEEPIVIQSPILKPPQTVEVAAGVSGVIDRVLVREGDVVNPGEPLLKIRDDDSRMALQQAALQAEIAKLKSDRDVEIRLAEKSSEVAEQEMRRALHANDLAPDTYPPNEIDRYRLMFERSRLEVEKARLDQASARLTAQVAVAEQQQAKLQVERHNIQSPIRAIVNSVDRQAGEWTDASSRCLELVAVEQLRLEGFVDADEASQLAPGQRGQVRISTPGVTIEAEAEISFVSPKANPVNGQVRIFMDVSNTQGKLRPGLPVTAKAWRKPSSTKE
jgi:multidrug efflux pump subunit AcrA (membrane-fusion protein)